MFFSGRRSHFLITVVLISLLFLGLLHNQRWRGGELGGLWKGKGGDKYNGNDTRFKIQPDKYLRGIAGETTNAVKLLSCPATNTTRYEYLRTKYNTAYDGKVQRPVPYRPYLFALNLHQAIKVLPRLMASIFQATEVLGPENCAISIVEGRSTDGTFEVLYYLNNILPQGVEFYFATSDIEPLKDGRMESLATLRNQALQPLIKHPELFSQDNTQVIFLNDVLACPDDILELIHQKHYQQADMTCAMDWNWIDYSGTFYLTFYDVWIARTMSGQSFFHIPHGGSWNESMLLFPFNNEADRLTRARYLKGLPFQAFACWNGGVVFSAKPIMNKSVQFRVNRPNECYQGEVSLFTKDLWINGYGKIAVVPSVNLGYTERDTDRIRKEKGTVSTWIRKHENVGGTFKVPWKKDPPQQMLCIPDWVNQPQYWVPWNE